MQFIKFIYGKDLKFNLISKILLFSSFLGFKDRENFIPRQSSDFHGERGWVWPFITYSLKIKLRLKVLSDIVSFYPMMKAVTLKTLSKIRNQGSN